MSSRTSSCGGTAGRVLAFAASGFVALLVAGGALGQSAPPDSLFRWKLSPVFELTSKGDVTSNDMTGRFNNTLIGVNGFIVSTLLSVSETSYRTQDRREDARMFSNSMSKILRPGLTLGLGYADNRRLSRTAVVAGGFQDFVLNNKTLSGDVIYASTSAGPLGWDSRVSLSLQDNEFAFKNDESQGGQVNGGVRYRFWDGGRVSVGVRGAYREFSDKSTSVLQVFDGLSTTEDSLVTRVNVNVTDSLDVGADWMDYNYERVFADQSRGASGGQQSGAENLFRETERREMRKLGFNMNTTPFRGLNFKASAAHSEQVSDYVQTPTRFSRTVDDELTGDLSYKMASGTSVTLRLENGEAFRDLGPQSVSSYSDVRKRASLSVRKEFTPTFSTELTGSQSLVQAFYVRFADNPRDRDQLDSSIRARVASSPFKKVNTQLFLSYTVSDFVNIHSSQSENNRRRERYDFQPTITYLWNERVTVEQGYGLGIEFTDFVYNRADNFLDRSVTFSNKVTHRPSKRLRTEFYYSLVLHDRGSYLPLDEADYDNPDAERFLGVEREDRTDKTRISFNWALNEHITLVAVHDYSRRRDETVGSGNKSYTTDGGIEGGAVGGYKWGSDCDLQFTLKRTERFSPFGTDEQKKYWTANLSFKYAF